MKKFTLTYLLLFASCLVFGQSVFINEIHYDNSGSDTGEFVEVAGPAGTDLSTFSIVLYNGNNGATYNTVALSGTIDDEGAGFGAISQLISGIQNGSPDGIALVDGAALVQFLSYEGSFTATNGPANGITSTDIGVSETSSTPAGESLQLTGTGNVYTDFAWNAPAAESPGSINTGQTFSAGTGNPPMITCPVDIVTPASPGLCETVVTFPDAIATDTDGDLDTVIQTGGLPSGSAFPVGDNTITFTATDLAGNSTSCSFIITVEDNEDPIAVCQDITVQLDANGQYTLDPSEVDGGSSDNCGNVNLSLNITTLDCGDVGNVPSANILYGADIAGNYFSIDLNTGIATVISNSFNTPGLAPCFVDGVGEIIYDESTNTAWGQSRDGCGYGFLFDPNTGEELTGAIPTTPGAGDIQGAEVVGGVWYTASITTSSLGTLDPNTGVITPIGPFINAPTMRGMAYDEASGIMFGATGGTPGGGDFGTINLITGEFTAIAALPAGMGSIEFAENGLLYGGVSGGPEAGNIYTIDVTTGAATLIGNTGLGTPVSGLMAYNVTGVVLTVTDDSGNTASCNVNVTVEDVTAPEVFCLGEMNGEPVFINELHYDNGGSDQDEAIEIAGPAGTDLSTYSIVLYNGNGGSEYNTITLSGTIDDEGNGYGAVNFPIAPIQNGSPDGIVLANGSTIIQFLSYEGSFTATDGIAAGMTSTDIGVEENGGTAIGESLQVTGTGSSSGDFGWNAPTASSPGDINAGQTFIAPSSSVLQVELDANGMASIDASNLVDSVNEACGYTVTGGTDTTELIVNGSFETMDLSDWTAIDNPNPFLPWGAYEFNDGAGFFDPALPTDGGWLAGNGFDGEAGEAVLYQDVSVPPGIVGATLTWDENIDYDLASFCTGCQDRIYEVQVRDLSDNVLEVLVQITATAGELESDNVWVSQTADLSAYAGQDIRIAYWQNMPDDFSGPAKFALDNVSLSAETPATTIDFDCSHLGLNTIEVTVTDDSGNTATCTATVEVLDVTAPILVCQDVTIGVGPDGTTEIDPEILLANMPSTYEVIAISSNNGSGAEGFTDFTVDVTADETVSFDWEYSTDDGPAWDRFGYTVNGTFTELTDENGANNQSGSASVPLVAGDVFGFRAQSEDGNFGAATTVVSNFAPGFEGQFDTANWTLTLDNSDGDAFFVEIPGGPLSFDACGITVLAVDVTEVTCDDVGTTITATVFASDASGNIASCTSQITVVDELGPEITCPADQTVDPGPGNLFYEVPDYFATGEATATDNCTDPVTITSQDPAAGTLIPDGTYTVTLTAEDEYGNVSTCEFELTVESVLGLDDNALDSAIALYPNPASSAVTLANTSGTPLDKAAIYDTNGRLVQTIGLGDMQQEKAIDVSALASGVYMVQITSGNASTVKRLVKE